MLFPAPVKSSSSTSAGGRVVTSSEATSSPSHLQQSSSIFVPEEDEERLQSYNNRRRLFFGASPSISGSEVTPRGGSGGTPAKTGIGVLHRVASEEYDLRNAQHWKRAFKQVEAERDSLHEQVGALQKQLNCLLKISDEHDTPGGGKEAGALREEFEKLHFGLRQAEEEKGFFDNGVADEELDTDRGRYLRQPDPGRLELPRPSKDATGGVAFIKPRNEYEVDEDFSSSYQIEISNLRQELDSQRHMLEVEAEVKKLLHRENGDLRFRVQALERAKTKQEAEENMCVICYENVKNVVLLPCRHLCACSLCAIDRESLVLQGKIGMQPLEEACPVCRAQVTDKIVAFV
ncbi:unnamed protein product [Amoebophrya sp. A25]|nr:unnamed protein product [Amoebophrya sp. A25]|eukprot:GSA25T00003944001.1